jgi:hypothetical protein
MVDDHPGNDYPPECRRQFARLMRRVAEGDIAGAMALQPAANECLGRHGILGVDMPEQYFRLMHQGIQVAGRGDIAEMQRVQRALAEVRTRMGITGNIEAPEA